MVHRVADIQQRIRTLGDQVTRMARRVALDVDGLHRPLHEFRAGRERVDLGLHARDQRVVVETPMFLRLLGAQALRNFHSALEI